MQSVYFHDKELFIRDVLDEYFADRKTGEVYEVADFQIELRELAASGIDLLAVIARDHAKTTSVCILLVIWMLIYKVEESILLIAAKGLGEDTIGKVRRTLENNKLIRLIYGQLVPAETGLGRKTEKWRQRELQLLNGTEIKAITKGEPIRGRRPTKVIIDDPQELKDVKNPRIALEFFIWVWTTVYPIISDSGSMVVLGTILSDNCFVNMLKQVAKEKNFRVVEYPAMLDFDPDKDVVVTQRGDEKVYKFTKGRPLWPSRWPTEKLERRMQKIGPEAFKQEYMNIPMVINSAPVFRNEYNFKVLEPIRIDQHGIKWFREVEKGHSYFLGVDPSKGRADGDPAAVVMRDELYRLIATYDGHIIEHLLASLIVTTMVQGLESFVVVPESNVGLAFLDAAREFAWHKKIWRKKTMDKVTNQPSEVLGWYTTEKNKSLMISTYDQVMGTGDWEISQQIKTQVEKYFYDENGGANAISPYCDDLLMADMLTVQGVRGGVTRANIRIL